MVGMFNKKSSKDGINNNGELQDNFDFITYNRYEKEFQKLKEKIENIESEIVLQGIVIKQKQKDAKSGFPTANIEVYKNILAGSYVSMVEIDNVVYHSISFVSSKNNFVKTYLLNFNQNLYGTKIKLTLLKFLHGEDEYYDKKSKFESMQKDIESVYDFFDDKIEHIKSLF